MKKRCVIRVRRINATSRAYFTRPRRLLVPAATALTWAVMIRDVNHMHLVYCYDPSAVNLLPSAEVEWRR